MKRSEITNNHLRILKDTQDNQNAKERIVTKTWLFIIIYSVAAISNALLDIADAIRESK